MSSIDLEKFDWDDFDHKHDAFTDIRHSFHIHSQGPKTNPKYWMLPGWVGMTDLMVIYGASGDGKTAFAVDTACRLAAGWDFEGPNETLYPRNVLYIATERSEQVRRRIDAFCKHYGGPRFDNLIVYDGALDLTQPYSLRLIVRSACWILDSDDPDIDVVITDTLASAMSASDSDPSAMAKAVNNLTDVTRNGVYDGTGCQVIVVHHTPVSGEARMRGAGQLQAAADLTVHVSRKRGLSTANVVKNNDTDARPCRSFAMQTVSLGTDDGVETTAPVLVPLVTSIAAGGAQDAKPVRPPRAQREALETLRAAVAANDNQPVTEKQWRAAVFAAAGDITEAGKRQRFGRHRKLVDHGSILEKDGYFSEAVA